MPNDKTLRDDADEKIVCYYCRKTPAQHGTTGRPQGSCKVLYFLPERIMKERSQEGGDGK